jgi:hypothetical protein
MALVVTMLSECPLFWRKVWNSFGLSPWGSWLHWVCISLPTAFCKDLRSEFGQYLGNGTVSELRYGTVFSTTAKLARRDPVDRAGWLGDALAV